MFAHDNGGMRTAPATCPARAWALFLLPALCLFLTGLMLHPLDPLDALALLRSDAIDFLLSAGLAARIPLLGALAMLLVAGIGLLLTLSVHRRAHFGYHAGLSKSAKPSRLLFQ